jgi:hypothetical protein
VANTQQANYSIAIAGGTFAARLIMSPHDEQGSAGLAPVAL